MAITIELFDSPKGQDIKELIKDNPIKSSIIKEIDFYKNEKPTLETNPRPFVDNLDIQQWVLILGNRIRELNIPLAYSMYFLEKGIPDDKWWKEGEIQSVEFFPDFDNDNWSNKYSFDFFSDTFFYKVFTVFETIGHLLFKKFDLEPHGRQKISFNTAISNLKGKHEGLYTDLLDIKQSDKFKKASIFRNDSTHNFPPYRIGNGFKVFDNSMSVGIGNYTPSKEVKKIMIGALECIDETLKSLHKHLKKQ
ncbi:Cthe_2314 family HEPN domain-containing protein [Priestia megaterium]|uniref:Cthe_2314 family HEPN domain-containing protein n=1 Tax=Priestia megaterium TaxID=1404 RepID=UPI001BE57190|nr:Cthe_2314 family HEPN domain-containing protein [Priestia megaterium]MBT2254429.1 hypothetical protein [Priestia megaterium]MBT2280485.1 hypothetical protein [Priestia megaterium]